MAPALVRPLHRTAAHRGLWHLSKRAPPASVRHIRTGFFPEDPDFIDSEAVLFADREGMRWRYMDDASLSAPVLERNNVGMGMLVLNRKKGLDLPMINELYRRLRNLEVNSLKRFVGLTAMDPGPFIVGLDPQELLLAAVLRERDGYLPQFSRALLWNHQELAYLIGSYYKPLVCQVSGTARGSGAGLACLANFAGAHTESEVRFDSCLAGLAPSGGASYVLGRLRWHLGEFLALTGWPVKGADLVYLGLVKHWLSPEALPFLELTSEKQLEMSEVDALGMLEDHSLPLPDRLTDASDEEAIIPHISKIAIAFRHGSVARILEALQQNSDPFSKRCVERMTRASPLALQVTLRLVQDARMLRARDTDQDQDNVLMEVLKLELRAQQNLLSHKDVVRGLHAQCLGKEKGPEVGWSRNSPTDVTMDEVTDVVGAAEGFEEFAVAPRSEISLSTHPRLRRYHPDFNPETGLDHDPAWMQAEAARWQPTLFAEERDDALRSLLRGADPSELGLSRFVRPSRRAGRP